VPEAARLMSSEPPDAITVNVSPSMPAHNRPARPPPRTDRRRSWVRQGSRSVSSCDVLMGSDCPNGRARPFDSVHGPVGPARGQHVGRRAQHSTADDTRRWRSQSLRQRVRADSVQPVPAGRTARPESARAQSSYRSP
jgi:hypothetical protein